MSKRISDLTTNASPAFTDMIETETDANTSKKMTLSALNSLLGAGGGGADADAIHDNIAAEISGITAKTAAARDDLFVIEDSAASNAKKSITLDNMLSSVARGGMPFFFYLDDTASDIGGAYKTLADKFTAATSANTASLTTGNDQLIFTYATVAGQPATTLWHEGAWYIRAGFSLNTLSRTCTVYAELYARAAGGTETLLGTSAVGNQDFISTTTLSGNSSTYSGYSYVIQSVYPPVALTSTDRLVVKFYANVTGAGSDGTVKIWMDDQSGLWAQVDSQMIVARIDAATGGNSFGTVAVSGQSDVVADTANDTLTLVNGTGITITTDAGADSITITASGGVGIPNDGWIDKTAETWTYASATTFTISGDLSATYQAGQRLKLTQTTVKYFIVTAVAVSGDTTVTIYGGTDYTLANAAISANYYSPVKAPFGFPMDPSKWTVQVTDTTQRNQASPTNATWYNSGSISIAIPLGVWNVEYTVSNQCAASSARYLVTLSTANNSESDADFTGYGGGPTSVVDTFAIRKTLTLAAGATYYLNHQSTSGGASSITFQNAIKKCIINAICAYL